MEKIRKTSFNKYFNKAFKDITGFDENEKKVIYEIFWNFITEHRIDRYFMDNHPIKDKFLCKDWTWKWYVKSKNDCNILSSCLSSHKIYH